MNHLIPNQSINLGNIQYGEKDIPFNFPYTGTSDLIDCIYVSCGSCTNARYDRIGNSISGTLSIHKVMQNAPTEPFTTSKTIFVEWNDGRNSWIVNSDTKVREYNNSKQRATLTLNLTILP